MNIKSLLLGSAVAAVAATGARAADAIVIAEPEPMEYVRICDVYGAGFFYIPGTETCLRIGGYMRYQMNYSDADWDSDGDGVNDEDYRFSKFARFQLNVDARNETEWGTLRSYAEARFDWSSYNWVGNLGVGGGNNVYLNQGFIELQQANGTIRLGKSDTPYARFLGYGSPFGPFDGSYGFNNGGELSYQYNGANGFSAILAVVETNTGLFEPAVEGGVKLTQGWGDIGAMVGYDTVVEEWGAKLVGNAKFGMVDVGAHLYYASGPGSIYTIGGSEFSVLAYAKANVSQTLAIAAAVQYFDDEYLASNDTWQVTGGLDWRPISGLRIRPEVQYTTTDTIVGDVDNWRAAIRFDRTF